MKRIQSHLWYSVIVIAVVCYVSASRVHGVHGIRIVPTVCAQATTPCTATNTPPNNGNVAWPTTGTKSVYVDPSLPNQTQIRQAITDFATQSGMDISAMPAGATQPATNTQDTIQFLNNPSASPNNNANTQDFNNQNAQSVPTSINHVTTNFNFSSTCPAAGGGPCFTDANGQRQPDYDPNQPNASTYVYGVILHELIHAFGGTDFASSSQPATGTSQMQDAQGTNDQGKARPNSVTPCDKQTIQTNQSGNQTGNGTGGGSGGGGGGDGSGGGSGGGGGGGGGGGYCIYWDDWDDETNTDTGYSSCT